MSKPPNPELSKRILAIALEELDSKPPGKVNMRSIAEKAGVTPTAIYYYFASKDELFERIKFDAMAELDARLSESDEPSGAPKPRLAALMRSFARWCLERPHLARLLLEELPPREELGEEAMGRYYGIFFRARDLLEAGIAAGDFAARDVLLDVSMAQAALWGIVSQFRAKRVHPRFWASIDPLIDRFIELYFNEGGNR